MPKPLSRRELIKGLRAFGWEGPFPSRRHEFMSKDGKRVFIPNPHGSDIDWSLTRQILRQAGIDPKEWEKVRP